VIAASLPTRLVTAILLCLVNLAASSASGAPALAAVVTLDEARAAALRSHERLAVARADEERAAVAPWRALSALAPSLTATGSYTREKEAIEFPTQPGLPTGGFNPLILARDPVRGILSATQPIYTHQFWALRELGQSEVTRSAEAYRAAVQDVILSVTAAYYEMLRAVAVRRVAEESAELAAAELKHARTRYDVGESLRSDVLRAETEAARATQRIAEARGAVDVAAVTLARLTGINETFDVLEPPQRVLGAASPSTLLETARVHNPDLLQAEQALATARAEEARREATLYPTLVARGSYRLVNEETFVELNNFWQVGVAIDIPLLEAGGTRYLDLAEQRARVKGAEAQLAGLRRDLELEIGRAFVRAQTLEVVQATVEKEATLASDTYHLLSRQYEAGAATSLDVLSALTARATAQSNRAAVRYTHGLALTELDRLQGTLDGGTTPQRTRQ